MFDRAEWNRAYNKERYQYYKAKCVCVNCGAADARIGKTTCEECAIKDKERHDRIRDRTNAKARQTRIERKAAGICTTCGKRKARPDRYTCKICAKSQHDRDMDRIVRKRMDRWRLERGTVGV